MGRSLIVKNTSVNKKTGRVTYRKLYPLDVRSITGWELKVALGIEGSPGVLSRWEEAANKFEADVALARRKLAGQYDQLDSPTIAYLAEKFRVEQLADDEAARWDTEGRAIYAQVAKQLGDQGIAADTPWQGVERERWGLKARETLEMVLPHYREMRAAGDLEAIVDHWRDEAQDMLEADGRLVSPDAHAEFAMLCRAMNDAAISAGEAKLQRLDGSIVETPPEPLSPSAAPAAKRSSARVPLLDTYEGYAKARQVSPGVREEWRRYIKHLITFLGHDDAARLTAAKLREWRDHLLTSPTRQGKSRTITTVRDKYLTSIKAVLTWAVEEELLSENVALQVVLKKEKKARLRDPSFSDEEALAILTATLLPPKARLSAPYVRARRWIPWLCAYTGARVNEFSQMRKEDLQFREGMWVVRITPEAGRVKTAEARIVPLHSHLIEQGFVEMVEALPDGPVFYDPSQTRKDSESGRHYKKVGEKVAVWVRKDVGIDDPVLQPNHAWRHRFKSLSYLHGIEERTADVIQGHAPATTGRKYGPPGLVSLSAAIERLPRYAV